MIKKIIFLMLISISLLNAETKESKNIFVPKLDKQAIKDINFYEQRGPLNEDIIAYLNGSDDLQVKVVKLTIPPILNTDISCGGFRASMGDVLGVLASQLDSIAEQIPSWIVQETLGVPLDSPTEILRIIVDFMVEGYCWGEVAGVQATQSVAEGALDFTSRLFETYEEEDEKAVGTPNLNGNVDMPAEGHEGDKEKSAATNNKAGEQAAAEATEQAEKETYKKVAECVKAKKKFIAEVLDLKVKKFLPLAYQKKEMLQSACEMIKEKGKKNNLNESLNIPSKIYSPLMFKGTKEEDLLMLDGGTILVQKQKTEGAIQAWINNDKLNNFFENDFKLNQYKSGGGTINKKILMDLGTSVLNGLTECLNNPDGQICSDYQTSDNFFLVFNEPVDTVKGFQTILLEKKVTCSVIDSNRFNLNGIKDFFDVITKMDGYSPMSLDQAKFILDNYVLKDFCGRQFKKEVSQLEKFLYKKLENESRKIASDYSLTLSQLKAYSVLNSAFMFNKDSDSKEELLKVCAFNTDEQGKPKQIYYLTASNGIQSKSGPESKSQLEEDFGVKIENLATVSAKIDNTFVSIPVIMNSKNDCVYDLSSPDFEKLYQDYLAGQQKQVTRKRPLTRKKYAKKLLEERQAKVQEFNRVNGYLAELRSSVLQNVLKKQIEELLLKLNL